MATDAVSIGPYVLSGGELPAMVLLDAVARRLPGALREESGAGRRFSAGLEGGFEFPQYTRPAEFRGWQVPEVLLSGDHARIDPGAREQSREQDAFVRGPSTASPTGCRHPWPTIIDWVVTIVVAVGAVLAIKAWVVNPYRIPSSSMEPTLHCARAGDRAVEASFSDRVLANRFIYHFRDPHRGDIVVFDTPPTPEARAAPAVTFVKRIIGLPGDVVEERRGIIYINGERLDEPYLPAGARDHANAARGKVPEGSYFMMGDNRCAVLRQPGVGLGAPREPHRPRFRGLLAAAANRLR